MRHMLADINIGFSSGTGEYELTDYGRLLRPESKKHRALARSRTSEQQGDGGERERERKKEYLENGDLF
jgi:hypothetical protein